MQFAGFEQGGEDRAGEIAAVAPERGRARGFITGDEAGDDDAPLWMPCAPLGQARGTDLPVDADTQFTVADDQYLTCIKQGALLAERFDVGAKQGGRPHFAKALDRIERLACRNAEHGKGLQGVGKIGKARFKPDPHGAGAIIEQVTRGFEMALAQAAPLRLPGGIARCRSRGKGDQRIGHALHGRDHGDLGCIVAFEKDGRDPAKTRRIGERGATELVRDDRLGIPRRKRTDIVTHGSKRG